MATFLVTIHDKELRDEFDIAIGVVQAAYAADARSAADWMLNDLANAGRARCVVNVREVAPGMFYRLETVLRLPRREG